MRFVRKNLKEIPPALTSVEALAQLEKIANGEEIDKRQHVNTYRGNYKVAGRTRSQVSEYLHKYYHNKCAYCEMILRRTEIDHYRPQKKIVKVKTNKGYFWLCYEWTNLLPTCQLCNTGGGGKGYFFPIISNLRQIVPHFLPDGKLDKDKCQAHLSPLIDEQPYLLHPEIDENMETFFSFKIEEKNGHLLVYIMGIDSQNRGQETINICDLNRDDVVQDRQKEVIEDLKKDINKIFIQLYDKILPIENFEKALFLVFKDHFEESLKEDMTHTLLRKFIVKDVQTFSMCFGPYLENPKQRNLVIEVFKNYKNKVIN